MGSKSPIIGRARPTKSPDHLIQIPIFSKKSKMFQNPFTLKNKRMNNHSLNQEAKSESTYLAFANIGQPVWTPRDFAAFAKEGYRQNPIAYRCVRMIAESAASVPMRVNGKNGELHPYTLLLKRPNVEQTGAEFIEAFLGHLQIAGNAYLELIAIDGEPREMCVLRPDNVRVIQGANSWPVGWEYRQNAEVRRLWRDPISGRSDVLHLKLFNPIDELYGQSPIEAAATAIDIHNAGGAWNKALIDNAARPSGALVYRGQNGSERLSDDQFERLKAELSMAHTGAANAGRPLLLEGGLEWSPMSLSPAEMDFVEARRAAARDIALAFGVPPMLLGIPGDNTYSNYKEANNAFWRQSILPLLNKLTGALSAFLTGWAEEELTVNADFDAVPALSVERESLWARIDTASFLSIEEKRKLAGLS